MSKHITWYNTGSTFRLLQLYYIYNTLHNTIKTRVASTITTHQTSSNVSIFQAQNMQINWINWMTHSKHNINQSHLYMCFHFTKKTINHITNYHNHTTKFNTLCNDRKRQYFNYINCWCCLTFQLHQSLYFCQL